MAFKGHSEVRHDQQKWIDEQHQQAHQAADAVMRAIGGNGVKRQPEAVIERLLIEQHRLMRRRG